jgi:Ser/Thr protein kinase RdoA (MazF antagonist)
MSPHNRSPIPKKVWGAYSLPLYPAGPIVPELTTGFSSARVWRVDTKSGLFGLRAMPADEIEIPRLAGLHRLLKHVFDQGVVQVAIPLARLDGSTITILGDQVWQLEPWMPGVADLSGNPSERRVCAATQALARWHLAAATFRPHAFEEPWFFSTPAGASDGIAERQARLASWNTQKLALADRQMGAMGWAEFSRLGSRILELFRDVAPGVAVALDRAAGLRPPLLPCLRDVWSAHILFTGDEVTGLIDAHACRSDCVATDLARLLGTMVGDDRRAWDIGLAAYNDLRPLSSEEEDLVEVFDKSGVLLSAMNWIDWCVIEQRASAQSARLIARLATFAARLEKLAEGSS